MPALLPDGRRREPPRCRARAARRCSPTPSEAIYDEAYARYRAVYDALRPVFTLGAGPGGGGCGAER